MTLAYAGCWLSEALALTANRADLAVDMLVFERPKKPLDGDLSRRVHPLPRSMHVILCTVSAEFIAVVAEDAALGSGHGRG
jgi:hypothetical protein